MNDDLIKLPEDHTYAEVIEELKRAGIDTDKLDQMIEQIKDLAQKLCETIEEIGRKLVNAIIGPTDDDMESFRKLCEEANYTDRIRERDDHPDIIQNQFPIQPRRVLCDRKYLVHPRFKNRPPGALASVQHR